MKEEPKQGTVEFDRTPVEAENAQVEREIRRMSRRSFLGGGVAVGVGIVGWRWLVTRPQDGGMIWPLRRVLEANEQVGRKILDPAQLAQVFPTSRARKPRINGAFGLVNDNGDYHDVKSWSLKVSGLASGKDLTLSLDDLKKLPKYEETTQLLCIEGWSEVVSWGGARLVDFVARYPPQTKNGEAADTSNQSKNLVDYVSLTTPDKGYYVGLDMASALHPQTLLCYEMNGKPLTVEHGAPLRLVSPIKYGIKYIKCIGAIHFTNQRPADYWAEQGYDWYAGH